MLHFTLSKLPSPLDLEAIIASTMRIYHAHPPDSLPNRAWSSISSLSVLKTTRDSYALQAQTLEDGEKWLGRQVAQIRRAQQLQDVRRRAWGMRRQGGYFGVALIAGILSYWLRSPGGLGVLVRMFGWLKWW